MKVQRVFSWWNQKVEILASNIKPSVLKWSYALVIEIFNFMLELNKKLFLILEVIAIFESFAFAAKWSSQIYVIYLKETGKLYEARQECRHGCNLAIYVRCDFNSNSFFNLMECNLRRKMEWICASGNLLVCCPPACYLTPLLVHLLCVSSP